MLLDWAIDYIYLARGSAHMYWHRQPPRHYLGYVEAGKVPVLLLPGIALGWGFLKPLGDQISRAGHPVYAVPDLRLNFKAIAESAAIARQVIKQHDLRDVIIMAHSKGGLIGKRLMVDDKPDPRFKGMIAVGTPFAGSRIAKAIPHPAYIELWPESPRVAELSAERAVNARIISIRPKFDNHIWPAESSYLEGAAQNLTLEVKGHHKILFNPAVRTKILALIVEMAQV